MKNISIKACGKINLSLDIVGKDHRGYHLVDMILQSVDVYDLINIDEVEAKGITIECNKAHIPTDESNIAYKAALCFLEATKIQSGIAIKIEKNIPVEAGMGGGSADGAAVLVGLNEMFNTKLSVETLKTLGLKLGADVPFCIEGGCVRARGVGEVLTKLPTTELNLLIVKPPKGVSTTDAYSAVNLSALSNRPDNESLVRGIKENNIDEIIANMGNVFYEISREIVPEIKFIVETMIKGEDCQRAMMSGSGSTVFGIFKEEKAMEKLAKFFDDRGYDTFCTTTCEKGLFVV